MIRRARSLARSLGIRLTEIIWPGDYGKICEDWYHGNSHNEEDKESQVPCLNACCGFVLADLTQARSSARCTSTFPGSIPARLLLSNTSEQSAYIHGISLEVSMPRPLNLLLRRLTFRVFDGIARFIFGCGICFLVLVGSVTCIILHVRLLPTLAICTATSVLGLASGLVLLRRKRTYSFIADRILILWRVQEKLARWKTRIAQKIQVPIALLTKVRQQFGELSMHSVLEGSVPKLQMSTAYAQSPTQTGKVIHIPVHRLRPTTKELRKKEKALKKYADTLFKQYRVASRKLKSARTSDEVDRLRREKHQAYERWSGVSEELRRVWDEIARRARARDERLDHFSGIKYWLAHIRE